MLKEKNSIIKSYILFWKNAFNFNGRTRRSDFFNPIFINIAISILLSFFNFANIKEVQMVTSFLSLLYSIISLLPSISIVIRRLHDAGKSTYYYFLAFVPFVGLIILFVYLLKDSVKESNEYGESPKYIAEQEKSRKTEKYCIVCGSQINDVDYICPKCGSNTDLEENYGQL